jgi:hypothetical protein
MILLITTNIIADLESNDIINKELRNNVPLRFALENHLFYLNMDSYDIHLN